MFTHTVACPKCKKSLSIPKESKSNTFKCPVCKNRFSFGNTPVINESINQSSSDKNQGVPFQSPLIQKPLSKKVPLDPIFYLLSLIQIPVLDFLKPFLGLVFFSWWMAFSWFVVIASYVLRVLVFSYLKNDSHLKELLFNIYPFFKFSSGKIFFSVTSTTLLLCEILTPDRGIIVSFYPNVVVYQDRFLEQIPLTVTGYGKTKKEAEDDAINQAIKQRFGFDYNFSEERNNEKRDEQKKLQGKGVIHKYDVVSQRETEKNLWEVKIRVWLKNK